jgi:hypothetical protein
MSNKLEPKITKISNIVTYKIRNLPYGGWADISIDDYIVRGTIYIHSDYGDWNYYWGNPGINFKKFITTLNINYIATKFNEDKQFDIDKTFEILKKEIIDFFPGESLSYRKQLLQAIKDLMEETSNEQEYIYNFNTNRILSELPIDYPPICYKISTLFETFWKDCWSVFIQELKKELQNEEKIN